LKSAPEISSRKWKRSKERWRKNVAGRYHGRPNGHAANSQVPMCCSLCFKWTSVFIHTYLNNIH